MHAVQRFLSVEGVERLNKLSAKTYVLTQGRVGTGTKYSAFLLPQMPEGEHFLRQKISESTLRFPTTQTVTTYRN